MEGLLKEEAIFLMNLFDIIEKLNYTEMLTFINMADKKTILFIIESFHNCIYDTGVFSDINFKEEKIKLKEILLPYKDDLLFILDEDNSFIDRRKKLVELTEPVKQIASFLLKEIKKVF